MSNFADEEGMLNKNSVQHYAVKSALYDTFVDKTEELTKEITKTETLWKLMDGNQDGEISRSEFGETLGSLTERQVWGRHIQHTGRFSLYCQTLTWSQLQSLLFCSENFYKNPQKD